MCFLYEIVDEPLAMCLQDKENMEGKYGEGMSGILEKMTQAVNGRNLQKRNT